MIADRLHETARSQKLLCGTVWTFLMLLLSLARSLSVDDSNWVHSNVYIYKKDNTPVPDHSCIWVCCICKLHWWQTSPITGPLVTWGRCSEYFVQLFEAWIWLVCMLACLRLCVTSQLSRATLSDPPGQSTWMITLRLIQEWPEEGCSGILHDVITQMVYLYSYSYQCSQSLIGNHCLVSLLCFFIFTSFRPVVSERWYPEYFIFRELMLRTVKVNNTVTLCQNDLEYGPATIASLWVTCSLREFSFHGLRKGASFLNSAGLVWNVSVKHRRDKWCCNFCDVCKCIIASFAPCHACC